jgi:hypothetical protein
MPTATIRSAAGYLRSWVEAQAAHRRVPGVQVAIRSGDELALSIAVGRADAVAGTPLMVLVRHTLADPLPAVEELEVVDARTLRVAAQPSFGPAGELVPLERDADGRVVSLRFGGVTSRPIDDFLRRRPAMTRLHGAADH